MEKQIQRDFYLNQLIANKDRSVCKVVTGMRRSGKSYLLFTLFYEWLLKNSVPESHIIKIDLETQKNKPFRDSEKLYNHLKSLFRDKERYYILLDEIQEVDGFEDLVNGLMVDHNCVTVMCTLREATQNFFQKILTHGFGGEVFR